MTTTKSRIPLQKSVMATVDSYYSSKQHHGNAGLVPVQSARVTNPNCATAHSPNNNKELLPSMKMLKLLDSLKKENFVGRIDPEFHYPNLSSPNHICCRLLEEILVSETDKDAVDTDECLDRKTKIMFFIPTINYQP